MYIKARANYFDIIVRRVRDDLKRCVFGILASGVAEVSPKKLLLICTAHYFVDLCSENCGDAGLSYFIT